jgi:hypothetical protein
VALSKHTAITLSTESFGPPVEFRVSPLTCDDGWDNFDSPGSCSVQKGFWRHAGIKSIRCCFGKTQRKQDMGAGKTVFRCGFLGVEW